MKCYVCALKEIETEAIALCKSCQVGLCLEHLQEDYESYRASPKYSCTHIFPPRRMQRSAVAQEESP